MMKNTGARVVGAFASLICVLLAGSCGNAKEQTQTAVASAFSAQSNNAGTLSVALPDNAAAVKQDTAKQGGGMVEIKEKLFIAQVNDVYLNPEEYLGKTIKLQGLFKTQRYEDTTYCFVLRYGPGCCGSDGNAGFEVAWDDSLTLQPQYPKEDDWVEATGVLTSYEEDGFPYLYLALTNLTLPEARGVEFVTQ